MKSHLCFVTILVLLGFLPARADDSIRFSGKLLIGVRQAPLPGVAAPDLAEGWRLTPTLDTSGREAVGAALADSRAEIPGLYWVVASPPAEANVNAAFAGEKGVKAWDLAHQVVDGEGPGPYARLLSDLSAHGLTAPAVVEPDIMYTDSRLPKGHLAEVSEACESSCRADSSQDGLRICDQPSPHWEGGGFAWHLDDDKTQLRRAREAVPAAQGPDRVFVVHVDTGYNARDVLLPAHFDAGRSLDLTETDVPQPGGQDPCNAGPLNQPGHGTKTLSILAGARARVLDESGAPVFDDFLGGAPDVAVATFRVSDSVIHFYPRKLAQAIGTAAQQGADVVSISMGGLPSWQLRDAVNYAYESGTALFAASGDFFKLPVLCVSSPQSIVYPARFRRVVAVTGVTFDGRSYAESPGLGKLLRGHWSSWMLRGNYGPIWVMDEALAAYTPNVSWSRISDQDPTRLADLDGSGTSASTPQVAAAAALWLQKHRHADELSGSSAWRSWKKAEAVYRALLDSASPGGAAPHYVERYFGRGVLQAFDALERGVPDDLAPRAPARIGLGWLHVVLGLGAPLAAGAQPQTDQQGREQTHLRMMRLEIAQLTYGSRRLERILGDVDPETLMEDQEKLDEFLRAVREDPRASKHLKNALEKKGF